VLPFSLPKSAARLVGLQTARSDFINFTLAKEKSMLRVAVFVVGVAVGAIGTLATQNPKNVAEKVREAATLVVKKLRDTLLGEGPTDGTEEIA
jgi:hypothetical protein